MTMSKWAALLPAVLLGCNGDTVVMSVDVVIPAEVPTIENGKLYLSFWAVDTNIADIGATLLDRTSASFDHGAGQRDTIPMQVAGRVPGGWQPSITVEGCVSTPGEGTRAVLWSGVGPQIRTVVEMEYLTEPQPCQSAAGP